MFKSTVKSESHTKRKVGKGDMHGPGKEIQKFDMKRNEKELSL